LDAFYYDAVKGDLHQEVTI